MRLLVPSCRWLALAVIATAAAAPCTAAEPGLEGRWLTEEGDAHVEITRCGEHYCGRIVWMADPRDEDGEIRRDPKNPDPALRDRTVEGMTILFDVGLTPNAKGIYTGVRLYDPKSGGTYKGKLELESPDRLRIRGYLGIPILGRTTHWSRIRLEQSERRPASEGSKAGDGK